MSKEKQMIEIKECIDAVYGADCAYYGVDGFAIANEIYNAGYRKQSKIEELENKLFNEVFQGVLFSLVYLGADGKWHTKRNNAEKTTAIIERYLNLVTIAEGDKE